MGQSTWPSWLVTTGAGTLGLREQTDGRQGDETKSFFYEYEIRTIGQDPAMPASLRVAGSISLLTHFFPSSKSDSTTTIKHFLQEAALTSPENYSSFISCILSFYYTLLSLYYLYLLIFFFFSF